MAQSGMIQSVDRAMQILQVLRDAGQPMALRDMMTEKVWAALDSLLDYVKNCELLHPQDETFARNSLLTDLKLESYEKQKEHYDFPECSTQSSWAE